jgi:hypothetical protein
LFCIEIIFFFNLKNCWLTVQYWNDFLEYCVSRLSSPVGISFLNFNLRSFILFRKKKRLIDYDHKKHSQNINIKNVIRQSIAILEMLPCLFIPDHLHYNNYSAVIIYWSVKWTALSLVASNSNYFLKFSLGNLLHNLLQTKCLLLVTILSDLSTNYFYSGYIRTICSLQTSLVFKFQHPNLRCT